MAAIKRWTVGEITRYIRQVFELDYRFQALEVEGEISNLRVPGSGHAYFTLKEEKAQLRCVMWREALQGLADRPQNGDRVIAGGRISVYEAGGEYQLYCETLSPAGMGDLHARFERLKARLHDEGLFDPERKRPIPERPRIIALVTGAGTAALQDVLTVLGRRYPLARVILADTPVQGEHAPPQIIAALQAVNEQTAADVILLVRGGGSLEDLWCFNDEQVVRAVAASRIPVVTGVGHEIDFTLVDFAADRRAPTPSAAAELVTPVTLENLSAGLQYYREQLTRLAVETLYACRQQVDQHQLALQRHSPHYEIEQAHRQLAHLQDRLQRAARQDINLRQAYLTGLAKIIAAMDPQATLARGYAIATDAAGQVIRQAADVKAGDPVTIRLAAGRLNTRIESTEEE